MEHKSQRYQYHGMTVVTTHLSRSSKLSVLQGMSLLLTYHGWQLWPGLQLSSLQCVSHITPADRCRVNKDVFPCDSSRWLKMTWLTCRCTRHLSDVCCLWDQVRCPWSDCRGSTNPRPSHPHRDSTQTFLYYVVSPFEKIENLLRDVWTVAGCKICFIFNFRDVFQMKTLLEIIIDEQAPLVHLQKATGNDVKKVFIIFVHLI